MWIGIEDTAHESVETSIFPDFVSFNVFHCGVPVRISSLVKIRYTWITRIYYCPIDKQPIVMSHLIKSIALERPTDNENSLSIVVCWNSCPVMFDHRTTRLWWEALVSALQQRRHLFFELRQLKTLMKQAWITRYQLLLNINYFNQSWYREMISFSSNCKLISMLLKQL